MEEAKNIRISSQKWTNLKISNQRDNTIPWQPHLKDDHPYFVREVFTTISGKFHEVMEDTQLEKDA